MGKIRRCEASTLVGCEAIVLDSLLSRPLFHIIQRMSKENPVLTRRNFLKLTALATIGVGITATGAASIIDSIPMEVAPIGYPVGGWLESSIKDRPNFIDLDGGHREYLRCLCLNHPVLKHALRSAYTGLFYTTPLNPNLGNYFQNHLAYAKQALKEVAYDNNPSDENCIHVAIITMAAVLSPYFTFGEVQDFGVPINVPKNERNKILQPLTLEHDPPSFVPLINIPNVFPADISQCRSKLDKVARCLGGDRAIHFAQHLFLTHQYLYAKRYNLGDYKRMTFLLKPIIALGITDIGQAAVLDFLAQTFWEYKESFIGKDPNIDGSAEIPTGMGDPTVTNDYAANSVGFWAARVLHEGNYTREAFERVRERLNRADIKRIYPPKSFVPLQRQTVEKFARSGVVVDQASLPIAV